MKDKEFICNYYKITRQKRTGIEWKEVVSDSPSQQKIYKWRAYAMLKYIQCMIENGKLGKDIIDVIFNYEDWIVDEVDD